MDGLVALCTGRLTDRLVAQFTDRCIGRHTDRQSCGVGWARWGCEDTGSFWRVGASRSGRYVDTTWQL